MKTINALISVLPLFFCVTNVSAADAPDAVKLVPKSVRHKTYASLAINGGGGRNKQTFDFANAKLIKNSRGGILFDFVPDPAETDQFRIKASSSTHIVWFSHKGDVICDMQANFQPRAISGDNTVFVGVNNGMDPATSDIKYTQLLENKAINLFESILSVVSDKCKVVYTRSHVSDGWSDILLSPNGNWLLIKEADWKKVNLSTREVFSARSDNTLEIQGIDNAGQATARKYIRASEELYVIQTLASGKQIKARSHTYETYRWPSDKPVFEPTGKEINEIPALPSSTNTMQ